MIPSDSYDVIVNICDIVQELNRLARFTIPIHIQTDSPLYSFLYQLSTIYSSIRIESFADSIGSSYLLCQSGLIIISASHLSLLQSLDNSFNHQWDKLSNPYFDPIYYLICCWIRIFLDLPKH